MRLHVADEAVKWVFLDSLAPQAEACMTLLVNLLSLEHLEGLALFGVAYLSCHLVLHPLVHILVVRLVELLGEAKLAQCVDTLLDAVVLRCVGLKQIDLHLY